MRVLDTKHARDVDDDHDDVRRTPGRATLTSRLPASATSIAQGVVRQLQAKGDLAGPDANEVPVTGMTSSARTSPLFDQIQRAFGHQDIKGVRASVGGSATPASEAEGARLSDALGPAGDEHKVNTDARESAHDLLDPFSHRGALCGPVGQAIVSKDEPGGRVEGTERIETKADSAKAASQASSAAANANQRASSDNDVDVHDLAESGFRGQAGTLPHLDAIQRSFGRHDVTAVVAYVGGAAEKAARGMGALAYASGNRVAFAMLPELHVAAHEAAHVVQQRGGVSLTDGVGASGDAYEQHADAVASLVVRGESAEELLDQSPSGGGGSGSTVQRWQRIGAEYYVSGITPLIGEPDRRTAPILVGTETEWREETSRSTHSLAEDTLVLLFLRACYMSNEEVRYRAARDEDILGHRPSGVLPPRVRRELERPPTHDEKVALAKALYVRDDGAQQIRHPLMARLIAECQPSLLERLSQGTFEPRDDLGSAVTQGGESDREQMLVSASGSLLQGLTSRIADYDQPQADTHDRMIRYACSIVRTTLRAMEEREAAERAVGEALVTRTLGLIPVPAAFTTVFGALASACFNNLRDAVKTGVIAALTRSGAASARLDRIRRDVQGAINGLERPEAMSVSDHNTLTTALRALIDAGLPAS